MVTNARVLALLLLLAGIVLHSPLLGSAAFILAGATFITSWWLGHVERGLRVRHSVPETINYGERAKVRIDVANTSILPAPWVQLADSTPLALRVTPPVRAVFSLRVGGSRTIEYEVRGSRRGYFVLGPVRLSMGDVLGFHTRPMILPPAETTVFPRVMPLHDLGLPAQLPFGPLPSNLRRGEDPARPAGVRPYRASDGVRRLDWKSTARSGELMVRRAEPSVAPETTIALAFASGDYPAQVVKDSLERAAVVAASLGAALLARKLPISLISNGVDAKHPEAAVYLAQGKGDGQLQVLLRMLGRLEAVPQTASLWEALARRPLPWGGTLALIISDLQVEFLPHITTLRRRGQHLVLILLEPSPGGLVLARRQGLPALPVDERGVPHRQTG